MSGMYDLLAIADRLRVTFPEAGGEPPIHLLGEGFRSITIETKNGLVFRIAKNDEAARGHAKEFALLPTLRRHVRVPLPDPRWHISASDVFPHGVIGYPSLPGVPLQPASLVSGGGTKAIATTLGRFLRDLHAFSTEEAQALGVPRVGPFAVVMATLRDSIIPALRASLSSVELHAVTDWWVALLADDVMPQYPPVLCHADLWYENVLIDDDARLVTGIVDFESATIGDPAQDFATLRYLGDPFVRHTLTAYVEAGGTTDRHFAHRIERWWQLRDFDGLRFAMEHADAEEFAASIRKIRAGPILAPHARPFTTRM